MLRAGRVRRLGLLHRERRGRGPVQAGRAAERRPPPQVQGRGPRAARRAPGRAPRRRGDAGPGRGTRARSSSPRSRPSSRPAAAPSSSRASCSARCRRTLALSHLGDRARGDAAARSCRSACPACACSPASSKEFKAFLDTRYRERTLARHLKSVELFARGRRRLHREDQEEGRAAVLRARADHRRGGRARRRLLPRARRLREGERGRGHLGPRRDLPAHRRLRGGGGAPARRGLALHPAGPRARGDREDRARTTSRSSRTVPADRGRSSGRSMLERLKQRGAVARNPVVLRVPPDGHGHGPHPRRERPPHRPHHLHALRRVRARLRRRPRRPAQVHPRGRALPQLPDPHRLLPVHRPRLHDGLPHRRHHPRGGHPRGHDQRAHLHRLRQLRHPLPLGQHHDARDRGEAARRQAGGAGRQVRPLPGPARGARLRADVPARLGGRASPSRTWSGSPPPCADPCGSPRPCARRSRATS